MLGLRFEPRRIGEGKKDHTCGSLDAELRHLMSTLIINV